LSKKILVKELEKNLVYKREHIEQLLDGTIVVLRVTDKDFKNGRLLVIGYYSKFKKNMRKLHDDLDVYHFYDHLMIEFDEKILYHILDKGRVHIIQLRGENLILWIITDETLKLFDKDVNKVYFCDQKHNIKFMSCNH